MAHDVCVRCGTDLFTTTDPLGEHLCKDIRKRLARREKQKANVLATLAWYDVSYFLTEETIDEMAEQIVKGIVGMLTEDD